MSAFSHGWAYPQARLIVSPYSMQGLLMSRHGRSVDKQKEWGLVEELDFLDGMQKRERDASQIYDLVRQTLTRFGNRQ